MGITIILQLLAGDILHLRIMEGTQGSIQILAVAADFTVLLQDLILHRAIPDQVILHRHIHLVVVEAAVAAIVEAAEAAAMAAEAAEGDNSI